MTQRSVLQSVLLLACGALVGALVVSQWYGLRAAQPAAPPAPAVDLAALQADVARLKDSAPGQSHAMIDVSWHMTNLWFAAQQKHWRLATFELSETRARIRWMIRMAPQVKGPDGNMVDMQAIFDGIDTSSLAMLKAAVDKQDSAEFVSAYRLTLESCYSCHKATGRPYLRPMVPTEPPQTILNLDPNAAWPQ